MWCDCLCSFLYEIFNQFHLSFLFYITIRYSGLLGIAACIRFGSVYPVTSLGSSWYCVLVPSLWTALAVGQMNVKLWWRTGIVQIVCRMLLSLCWIVKKRNSDFWTYALRYTICLRVKPTSPSDTQGWFHSLHRPLGQLVEFPSFHWFNPHFRMSKMTNENNLLMRAVIWFSAADSKLF